MPRNGSGVMSKVAGTTAIPNTPIESSKFNAVIDDIIADLNFVRPITSGGTGANNAAAALANIGAQASLGFTPANKAGEGFTGDISVNKPSPSLTLHHPNVASTRILNVNGAIVIEDSGGQDYFYVLPSGAVWTREFGDLNGRINSQALAYANDRVANMAYRKVSRTYSGGMVGGDNAAPAGAVITGLNGVSNDASRLAGYYFHYLQVYDPVRGWVGFTG